MNKSSKVALVTGGSRGLGKDSAINLAKDGKDVIITYLSNEDKANHVVKTIESLGQRSAAIQLDVRSVSTMQEAKMKIESVLAEWEITGIDYLINNAGVGAYTPIGNTDEATFDNLVNVQFKGVYFLTETLLPIINDGGGIVNVSTGLTRFALPGYAAYAAMKGAVETFTMYLAKELGERGIRANLVAPGAIDNDFNKAAFDSNPQVRGFIASNTALGRVGKSEDIGSVVAFLCSDGAGWVNAQKVEASGGMFL